MAAFHHASSAKVAKILCKPQSLRIHSLREPSLACFCWRSFKYNDYGATTPFHGIHQIRYFSQQPQQQRKGFIGQILENIKQDLEKNKEMKESLKKFREEADKLEQSDALKKAREKYESIEKESKTAVEETLGQFKEKVSETLEEAKKSEFAKKSQELSEDLAKSAKEAAETITKTTAEIGKTKVFQSVSSGVQAVSEEITETAFKRARHYQQPTKLRKRKEFRFSDETDRIVEANPDATGVELHKESKWFQSWESWKENNQYVNKIFDLKMRYDESDNVVVRASRLLTDKLSDMFGGLFTKTELSEVLTEICKMDPNFDKEQFLVECEYRIIPNILEAMVRGDLEILKDWCYEAPFNVLAHPVKQAQAAGYRFDSKILDIDHVDLAMGKIMEQGPVLIITFISQQINCVRDKSGAVVEGDPEKVQRMQYVWVMCRDQTELDPRAAWRLLDLSANASEQWL